MLILFPTKSTFVILFATVSISDVVSCRSAAATSISETVSFKSFATVITFAISAATVFTFDMLLATVLTFAIEPPTLLTLAIAPATVFVLVKSVPVMFKDNQDVVAKS